MELSEFDYHLPEELIAQEPLPHRGASRMLVVDRAAGAWQDRLFSDLPGFLRPGDCLTLNDSRVFPCRLLGSLPDSGREAELFLLRPLTQDRREWLALARPGRRLGNGARVRITDSLEAEVLAVLDRGARVIRFHAEGDVDALIETAGHVPLPPYIHRADRAQDRERYQTVFARRSGSAAAPTAGLHFTPQALERCRAARAEIAYITLHVGLGTFQPLSSDRVEDNYLHSEWYDLGEQAAAHLRAAQRIVAVGTTTVRTLETLAPFGFAPRSGETDIFIYPGYAFRAAGAMLTNFHLPKSSLILLVSAFAGKELTLAAYRHAVEQRYRFFSYGDCMLIL